jgi:hypothetical protein
MLLEKPSSVNREQFRAVEGQPSSKVSGNVTETTRGAFATPHGPSATQRGDLATDGSFPHKAEQNLSPQGG